LFSVTEKRAMPTFVFWYRVFLVGFLVGGAVGATAGSSFDSGFAFVTAGIDLNAPQSVLGDRP
jgi:hypothetical protein